MQLERYKETLGSGMDKQLPSALDKYIDCTDEYADLLSMRAFHDGFCIGVRLMTAAFSGDNP